MSDLDAYRAKRRFDRTSEPQGGRSAGDPIFVVQKHRARRLHYDLRLQIGDTLRSWAVPQGPSLDPKIRRFAKLVEDHPLDYAKFEGIIPEGNYGAGEVIVWDRGTWAALEDPSEAFARGELKFRLAGEKLGGGWMLKRLPDDPTHWLLIKERDTAARPSDEYDVTDAAPQSVVSGRTVEDLAPRPPAASAAAPAPSAKKLKGARAADLPTRWSPQLASAEPLAPPQTGWLHEIKYDGYRTLVFFDHGAVRLITRNGLDWTKRYGDLAKAFADLPCETALLDGEIVVQDGRGVATLEQLERALAEGRTHQLTFFAFDLCHLDGYDLSEVKLVDRKAALAGLLAPLITPRSPVQYSEHIEGDGAELFAHACRMNIEGVVSKRADAKYVQGRTKTWVKVKRVDTAELAVIGFTTNAPRCVAALFLAEERDGAFVYAGRVGSGIGDAKARELFNLLSPAQRPKPVAKVPKTPNSHWIEPRWCAQIGHRGWTESGAPRQPVLLGVSERVDDDQPREAIKPRLVSDRDLAGIRLTNPDREIFPGSGVSKLDVALYYARVGDWMLPELLRRPVTLIRCPTGAQKDCFYQRHAFAGLPPGVERVELKDEEGVSPYITITEPKGFLALAQFGALEFHLWGCKVDDPEHPDRIVMDLDPDPDLPWATICDGAEILRAKMEAVGFSPFLRTTGGKGLHLVVALEPKDDWPTVKGFAEALARSAAAEHPDLFVAIATKAKRRGKIYVDYLRNGRGASAIASYSLRAKPDFTVATPIEWTELRRLTGANAFDRKIVVNRLDSLARDPWEGLESSAIRITPSMKRGVGMK